jgi:cell division protein YceG involved in septum cleavage
MDTSWTTTETMRHLIANWGVELCPGPSSNIYQYIHDETQCKAHAVTVKVGGQNISIFTAMEQQFFTNNDQVAFYDALTLASIVVREAGANPNDVPAVAGVYYGRFYTMAKLGNLAPSGDTIVSFDADPTAWYANDTDNPPANGKWWQAPNAAAKTVDPNNPYNTYTHNGLPPGPIATPRFIDLQNVLEAPVPTATSAFYFMHDNCGTIHLASTQAQQNANEAKYQNVTCK